MFYRLVIGGWTDPAHSARAALNRTWLARSLLPVLDEVTPHIPSIERGALLAPGGAPLARCNVSDQQVSARAYVCPRATEHGGRTKTCRAGARRAGRGEVKGAVS